MEKKLRKYFQNLFKVKTFMQLRKVLEETDAGTVTRTEFNDIDRSLKFIEYGFKEGYKKATEDKTEDKSS